MPLDLLLRGIWVLRWRVMSATLALLLAGGAAVLLWPRQYVAEAVVAPAETTGLATSTFIQNGLAIPGALLDTRASGNFAIYLSLLRSPGAAEMLARDTGLLAHLTALRRDGLTGRVRAWLGSPPTADLDDARLWLERNLSVTQSLQTVTTTLSIPHPDRAEALSILARLHAHAEERVREGLSDLARRRMAALEAQLAAERDVFVRTPIFELLAQHQRAAAIASVEESVAARLVSPPSVGLAPSLPNRPLLLMLLVVVAPLAVLVAAACVVLVRGSPPAREASRHRPTPPDGVLREAHAGERVAVGVRDG